MSDEDPISSSVTSISGGVNLDAGRDITIGGDVVGRDKIVSAGGASISGNVTVDSGSIFVGRDQVGISSAYTVGPVSLRAAPPAPTAHFIGREAELENLARLFKSSSKVAIIALCGMGGIGKTSLAQKLAEVIRADFPGGVLWWTLGPNPDVITALDVWARHADPRADLSSLPSAESRAEVVRSMLAQLGRLCVMMDDVWAAEPFNVLKNAMPPGCPILITTRDADLARSLRCRVERIDALSDEESIALLTSLIGPLDGYVGAALDIVHLTGGLPLALELIAGQADEPSDLLTLAKKLRVQPTLDVLKRGISREQSIEASLMISYEHLDPDLRRRFRALGVFALAPFDRGAIATVWGDDDDAADVVDAAIQLLTRRSLLIRIEQDDATVEYRQQALLRNYAVKLLHDATSLEVAHPPSPFEREDRDEREFAFRHAAYYRSFAQTQAWRSVEHFFDQIYHGWQWVQANAPGQIVDYVKSVWEFLDIRGRTLEALNWLQIGLQQAYAVQDRKNESWFLSAVGYIYNALGQPEKALDYYEQALAIEHEVGDRSSEGTILNNLGSMYNALGQPEKALDYYGQALAIGYEVDNRSSISIILNNLGTVYYSQGEYHRAIEYHTQALSIAREIGDRRGEGGALGSLGNVYVELGEPGKAIEYHEQALSIAREIGDRRGEGGALGSLGNVYVELGESRKAIEYYEQALSIAREIGDRQGEGADLGNIGLAYAALGETRKAIEFYEQRLLIAREIKDQRGEGNALGNAGNAYLALGEIARALEYYEQARVIARRIGDRVGEAAVSGGLGRASFALGEFDKALKHFEKQLTIVRELKDRRQEGATLRDLGISYTKLNENEKAVSVFAQSLSIVREIGDLSGEGDVLWALSEAERNRGDHMKAANAAIDAVKIYERTESPNLDRAYSVSLEYLGDPDAEVRRFAIGAIADRATKDARIRTAVVERLTDDDWRVRQAAVAALGPIAISEIEIRRALLLRLEDTNPDVQQEVIKALSSLVATDTEVRAVIYPRISRPSYERLSLDAIARDFFAAAGFEVRALASPLEFVCHAVAKLWKAKIDVPIYTQCLLGRPLDRDIVMNLYESARAAIDTPKLVFVVIDQTPDESGLIEIGALRAAEGVQIIPLDEAIIQQGRELQKEQEKLREYLLRFWGRRNLYDVRNPVVDRLNFFGRETRASELSEELSQGRPLALFGLRKMGKSSLLQYLRDNTPFLVAYVDLQAGEDLAALYNRILGSWQRSLRVRVSGFDWLPPKISAEASSSFFTATQELMTRLETSGHSSRLGLFIDEIEVIVPRPQGAPGTISPEELSRYMSFARVLRGIVQETDRLSLLVVGVDPQFNRISRWQGQQNPFYQFFREEYLGPLGRDECIQMIRNIGRQMELDYTDEAARYVADISGGHPFLARQLCSATVESMGDDVVGKIELSHLLKAAGRFIREPGTSDLLNENGLWGEVTDHALWSQLQVIENQNILTTLATSESQSEEVLLANGHDKSAREKSIYELEHRAILGRLEQLLNIRFGLFQRWIEKYQVKEE